MRGQGCWSCTARLLADRFQRLVVRRGKYAPPPGPLPAPDSRRDRNRIAGIIASENDCHPSAVRLTERFGCWRGRAADSFLYGGPVSRCTCPARCPGRGGERFEFQPQSVERRGQSEARSLCRDERSTRPQQSNGNSDRNICSRCRGVGGRQGSRTMGRGPADRQRNQSVRLDPRLPDCRGHRLIFGLLDQAHHVCHVPHAIRQARSHCCRHARRSASSGCCAQPITC